jgi:hypothetical protein
MRGRLTSKNRIGVAGLTAVVSAGAIAVPLASAHGGHHATAKSVRSGSTAVNLPAAVLAAITGDGITPTVVGPGQGLAGPAGSLYTVFPVTGGKVLFRGGAIAGGNIKHSGGLDFAGHIGGQTADLKITNFTISLATGAISARTTLTVGSSVTKLGRLDVFQLAGVSAGAKGHIVSGAATGVELTAASAGALNKLGTSSSAFTSGESVGSASFVAAVGRHHHNS